VSADHHRWEHRHDAELARGAADKARVGEVPSINGMKIWLCGSGFSLSTLGIEARRTVLASSSFQQ
jgi:hypothetical protein